MFEYVEMVMCWVKEGMKLLCFVKFMLNISDIWMGLCVVYKGGVDGVLLINMINLIVVVDFD